MRADAAGRRQFRATGPLPYVAFACGAILAVVLRRTFCLGVARISRQRTAVRRNRPDVVLSRNGGRGLGADSGMAAASVARTAKRLLPGRRRSPLSARLRDLHLI